MPKLSETFATRLPNARAGTDKYWDAEIKGLVLFVGKRSKTWYFQKDVGGQTKRILIGRFPIISAQAARQTALGFALEVGRGAGRLTYNPHMHRRTFATVAMEAGVLEEIVGRLLNHTPLSITGQRYARPSLDALRPSMGLT